MHPRNLPNVVLCIAVAAASSGAIGASPARADAQTEAVVTGTVTDGVTGKPIPLTEVLLYNRTTHNWGPATFTGMDGRYRVGGLGESSWVVRFTDDYGGYASELNGGKDPQDPEAGIGIAIPAGETAVVDEQLTPLQMPPAPAHTLSGRITDDEGGALPGVNVWDGRSGSVETDRWGRWFLSPGPGTYLLWAHATDVWKNVFGADPGWAPEYFPDAAGQRAATEVSVGPGASTDGVDIALGRASRIVGDLTGDVSPVGLDYAYRVYGTDGNPVLGPEGAGDFSSWGWSGDGRGYWIDIHPGTWRLLFKGLSMNPVAQFLPRWAGDVDSFEAATPIVVEPGQTTVGPAVHLISQFANLEAPTVSGTGLVGTTLAATAGTWSTMSLTSFTTTWFRGSAAVATGSSYRVAPSDAGRSLHASVQASNWTFSGTAVTRDVAVPRLAASIVIRASSPSRRTARLAVAVRSAGLTPTGSITVKRGDTVVKRVGLISGRQVVVLKRQPKGLQRYRVLYGGSSQVLPATSSVVRVKIR